MSADTGFAIQDGLARCALFVVGRLLALMLAYGVPADLCSPSTLGGPYAAYPTRSPIRVTNASLSQLCTPVIGRQHVARPHVAVYDSGLVPGASGAQDVQSDPGNFLEAAVRPPCGLHRPAIGQGRIP